MVHPNLPKGEEAPLSLPLGELSGRAESRPYGVVCSVFDSAQTDEKSFMREMRFGREDLVRNLQFEEWRLKIYLLSENRQLTS